MNTRNLSNKSPEMINYHRNRGNNMTEDILFSNLQVLTSYMNDGILRNESDIRTMLITLERNFENYINLNDDEDYPE